MTDDENATLFDRYEIEISNTERRNSSIAIQDCYIVYLIESRYVFVRIDCSNTMNFVLDREYRLATITIVNRSVFFGDIQIFKH
jgi:hypothetical protein